MGDRNDDRLRRMLDADTPATSHAEIYELWRDALANDDLDLSERLAEVSHHLLAERRARYPRSIG